MAKHILGKVLKRKKISARQFAKLLGRDYANVFRALRPGYNPTLATLSAWAKVLRVRVRDLIVEE